MSYKGLAGKVCLVTGAGRGIGRAIAQAFASEGTKVVAADLDFAAVQSLSEELQQAGGTSLAVAIDVTQSTTIDLAVSSAVDRFGSIDILVNNAGLTIASLLVDLGEDQWDAVCNVNLKGAWRCTKAVAPHMIKRGSGAIINLASVSGKTPGKGNGVYCVSKAGLIMLTSCWALELAQYGITVNAICPTWADTELTRDAINTRAPVLGLTPQEYENAIVSDIPLGRLVKPSEIAALAVFLAGEHAAFITGESVVIAGGKEMH
jgi:NAD(P)-dependent dehydrogenase (short-subunit alcohol dehydrogenase family)